MAELISQQCVPPQLRVKVSSYRLPFEDNTKQFKTRTDRRKRNVFLGVELMGTEFLGTKWLILLKKPQVPYLFDYSTSQMMACFSRETGRTHYLVLLVRWLQALIIFVQKCWCTNWSFLLMNDKMLRSASDHWRFQNMANRCLIYLKYGQNEVWFVIFFFLIKNLFACGLLYFF